MAPAARAMTNAPEQGAEERRCASLLQVASHARTDNGGGHWLELLDGARGLPVSARGSCPCVDAVILAVLRPTPMMLEGVGRLLAMGYGAKDPEIAYRFLAGLEGSAKEPSLASLIRRLLPSDYVGTRLYLGAEQPQAALQAYLRFSLVTPASPVSVVLREPEQLPRALRSAPVEALAPLVKEVTDAWRTRVLVASAATAADGPELRWLREVTGLVLQRAPLNGYVTQTGYLAAALADAGEGVLLAQGLARDMDLDDGTPAQTLASLLDTALCRRDVTTARLLVAALPASQRPFSLDRWLLCLPARELGGRLEPMRESLQDLLALGGSFSDELEGAAPAEALAFMGWPELSALVVATGPQGAQLAASEQPAAEVREHWRVRRLASIVGEDYPLGEDESAQAPSVRRVELGGRRGAHYVLSGGCGNVNCALTFFALEGDRYRVLLQTAGYSWQPKAKHRGLVDLDVWARASASTHCGTLYRFDGQLYQPHQCRERDPEGLHWVPCPPCP